MSWIEPLELQTWFMSVLSGTPDIFVVLALIFISSMAGYFRMNGIGMFFMIAMFLFMFSSLIASPLIIFISVMGGLLIGYTISRMFI